MTQNKIRVKGVNSGPPILYNALTMAWISATGETDVTILGALNTLETNITSILSKAKAIYPYVGGNATKHSFNFANTALYQITWNGGVTHSSNGFQGNGTNGYGNTGIIPSSVLSLNNACVGSYFRTDANESSIDFGSQTNSNADLIYIAPRFDGDTFVTINGTYGIETPSANSLGLFSISRLSNNQEKFYKNGTLSASITEAQRAYPNNNIGVGCLLRNNAPVFYSSRQHAFDFVFEGLNDSEQTLLYNAIQSFQTTLARNV